MVLYSPNTLSKSFLLFVVTYDPSMENKTSEGDFEFFFVLMSLLPFKLRRQCYNKFGFGYK